MLGEKILEYYGAEINSYAKGEIIFEEGAAAQYYYQIIHGGVKMNYYNEKGNEFIQGIFGKNKSFGEPPLFIDVAYPANAIAMTKSSIYLVKKNAFKQLLMENSEEHYKFTKMISNRLYYKATMANGITSNSAEEAILTLLKYLKQDIHDQQSSKTLRVDLTRKNIAGLLGLSVEATIRTIKKMEAEGKLSILKKKIYY